ncbi:MAG: ABC transporter substrate-binding protein [Thalassobaculales bacterium]
MSAWRNHAAGVLALIAAAAPAASPAQELRVGFTQDALTLDPANHRSRETETVIRNMMDGLLTRDAKMAVVPELAESYVQVDALTYDFTLRQGVTFHDGQAMTAEDVKFTFDRLTKPGAMGGQTSPRQSLLGPLSEVTIRDQRTVRFTLKEPWPILPPMLPFQEVVSKAFTEKHGSAALATMVNGTGPFKLVEWRRGDAVIMERFAGYYGGATDIPPVGPAKVERVIFKVIPDNAARVAALLAGEVHIINELPPSAMRQVEASSTARVAAVNGTRTFFVAFNTAKKPFDDVRVRRALNHAVDKKLIIARILNGTATPLNGVLSPDAFAFNDALPEYRYDPDLARRLLAEAGVSNLSLTIDTQGAFKEVAEAIAAMLQRVGVQARAQIWEGAVLTPIWQNKDRRAERDMFLTSWGNGSLDPSDIMMPTLRSGGRGNSAGYQNAEVDRLIDAADIEVDRAKRRQMYLDAQAKVNADAPWIFLWLPQDLYGVSRRLKGWQPSADSRINLHDAYLE